MNILFLATSLEDGQAGAAHHSIEFINSLASRRDLTITVFTTSSTDRLADSVQVVKYRWPPTLRFLWRVQSLLEVWRLARELRRHSLPKMDFCYTRNTSLGLAIRTIAPTVPIISHIGSVIASREFFEESAVGVAGKWVTQMSAWLADRREVKSYASKQWLHLVSTPLVACERSRVHKLPTDLFRICPLGSSAQRFNRDIDCGDIRGTLTIPETAHVLISVARLVRWKNIDMVIRGLSSLRRKDSYLIVVGGGPELTRLRQLAVESGVAERTRFVGQVANPAPYYAASNVFVLPSEIESFGNVYAEAMLMGLPCIGMRYQPPSILSSAEDVIPEAVAGFCISNFEELLKRLNYLADDNGALMSIGAGAYQHAINNYTIDKYSETVLGLAQSQFRIGNK